MGFGGLTTVIISDRTNSRDT